MEISKIYQDYLLKEDSSSYTINRQFENRIEVKNHKNEFHSTEKPSIIYPCGSQYWYHNNKIHRNNDPAVMHYEEHLWYHHGKLGRQNKPSILRRDGSYIWSINNKYHRIDGFAVCQKSKESDASYELWLEGKPYQDPQEYAHDCIQWLLKNENKHDFLDFIDIIENHFRLGYYDKKSSKSPHLQEDQEYLENYWKNYDITS